MNANPKSAKQRSVEQQAAQRPKPVLVLSPEEMRGPWRHGEWPEAPEDFRKWLREREGIKS